MRNLPWVVSSIHWWKAPSVPDSNEPPIHLQIVQSSIHRVERSQCCSRLQTQLPIG
jgi:hypothetical protein